MVALVGLPKSVAFHPNRKSSSLLSSEKVLSSGYKANAAVLRHLNSTPIRGFLLCRVHKMVKIRHVTLELLCAIVNLSPHGPWLLSVMRTPGCAPADGREHGDE